MNIAKIKELDIGMKGITCSGEVIWAGNAKNITGTSGSGNDYDFWSQFIVIKDATDKIGVSIIIEDDRGSIRKGDMVTIEKAELQEYLNKDNEPTLKLQGKLQVNQNAPQNSPQAPPQPAQPTKAPQRQDTPGLNREQVRSDVICAILASRNIPKSEDVEKWVNVIINSVDPNKPQNSPVKAQFCDECRNLKEECTCNDIPF